MIPQVGIGEGGVSHLTPTLGWGVERLFKKKEKNKQKMEKLGNEIKEISSNKITKLHVTYYIVFNKDLD